jgi:1-acyl-sn-glycerol-3-phosphate acyltransferase
MGSETMKDILLIVWYRFWQLVASLGLKMYFSSLQVNGLKNVPAKGPIILAVNHQNSFLDAIIVACVLNRKSYFLARGDVFRKKWAHTMLSSLGIMPIYRTRDGLGKVKDNTAIFNACSEILKENGAVMIFPEGNHYMRWSLRPLQRGIARIAFQSRESAEIPPIKIVPVGLQYEAHMTAASRILVQIGEPVDVEKYLAMENVDQRTKMDLLLHDLFNAMNPLILDIPEEGYESLVEKLKAVRGYFSNQVQQLQSDQGIISALLNSEPVEVNVRMDVKSRINYLVYPIIPVGWITHILPRLIISTLIRVKVKDPQFIAPLNFALGLLIYPANAIAWGVIITILSCLWVGILSSIVILLIGKLTLRYWH